MGWVVEMGREETDWELETRRGGGGRQRTGIGRRGRDKGRKGRYIEKEIKYTHRLLDLLLNSSEFSCDPALLLLLLFDVLLNAIPLPTLLLHHCVLLGQFRCHLVNLPLIVEQAEQLQVELLLRL